MRYSVLKSAVAAVLFASAVSLAAAATADSLPRFLPVPVVGLRVPLSGLDLEAFPDDLRALCTDVADDSTWTGHLWVFAKARYEGTNYYVVSGYLQRRVPEEKRANYVVSEAGGLQVIRDGACSSQSAREIFELRDFEDIPRPALQALAADLARSLVRAFGTVERVRAELKNQRIDVGQLPPEVRDALVARVGGWD